MSESAREVRVLVTLRVEKIKRAKKSAAKISRGMMEHAAVEAVKSALYLTDDECDECEDDGLEVHFR